jgi:predicted PurR-regulated permease PerM
MDLFVFFLGVFTVLFIISLALSYINFFSFLKLNEKVGNVQQELVSSVDEVQDNIDDVQSDLADHMDNSIKDIYAIINKTESKLDAIIARLEAEKK